MPHNKTLYQLASFKWAIFTPLAIGLIVAIFIVYHDFFSVESMSACWTSECINNAVIRLKVPITIMALVFPAVALVASQHRSAQTAAQIERTDKQIAATEAKNAFESNITHRKIFFENLQKLEKDANVLLKRKEQIYKIIFIKNDYTDFDIYTELDVFRKRFFGFYREKTNEGKVNRIRCVMKNSLAIELSSIEKDNEKLFKDNVYIVSCYHSLIDGLADACLSEEDKGEIYSSDLHNITDLNPYD